MFEGVKPASELQRKVAKSFPRRVSFPNIKETDSKTTLIFMGCMEQLEKSLQLSVFYRNDVGHRKLLKIYQGAPRFFFFESEHGECREKFSLPDVDLTRSISGGVNGWNDQRRTKDKGYG